MNDVYSDDKTTVEPKSLTANAVPPQVRHVLRILKNNGFHAFLVGGSVRNLIVGIEPEDFDIATNARPPQIESQFDRTEAVGKAFGTILVMYEGMHVDVTTFRTDINYTDGRRPDKIFFGRTIEEDLSRRDLTINAIAWDPLDGIWIDPFGGMDDIKAGVIRAVGNPTARFTEDALRTLRAVRFAAQFDFFFEEHTLHALDVTSSGVHRLSGERIRDEILRMMEGPNPEQALWMLRETGLLFHVLPELKGTERVAQHKRGAPTLLDHLILTAAACPSDPIVRLAGLFHDVGKMTTRRVSDSGQVTFHGHPEKGAEVAREICKRWRLSKQHSRHIVHLVAMHMAPHGGVQKKTIRKWVSKYGARFVEDLLSLAVADSIGSGYDTEPPEIAPMRQALSEVIADEDALTLKDLAINGKDIMEAVMIDPGPFVGHVLNQLLSKVLEDPSLNDREQLLNLAKKFGQKDE